MSALLSMLTISAGAATNVWSGTWQTTWTGGSHGTAEMVLTQEGNHVGGTYDHRSGTIQGSITADRLDGTWTQNNSHGSLSFVLAVDGRSWSGTWTDSVSGGGSWSATCTTGPCLGPPAATPTVKRPSATVVQCDRDATNTTNAHFNCRALVNDIGAPAQTQKPSGVVKWTATKGSFMSGDSCQLAAPDVGAASCGVAYDAQNQDAPIGSALPVTAVYSGDDLFAPSVGSHTLFPGPAQAPTSAPNGGIPGWALALAATAALGSVGLAIAWVMHSHAAADTPSGLMGGIPMPDSGLLVGLGFDGAQLDAAVANMTPAAQIQALEELNHALTQAAGPPSLSVPTAWPSSGPNPAAAAHPSSGSGGRRSGGMGSSLGMAGDAGGLFSSLGINPDQLHNAISQMTPDQIQQVQQNIRDALSRAVGGN